MRRPVKNRKIPQPDSVHGSVKLSRFINYIMLDGKKDRSAQFRTVISLVNGSEVLYFEGIVRGKIAEKMSGNEGFGYDPIFIPDGYEDTFADLDSSIKNTISHRARAVTKLIDYLNKA